MKYFFFLNGLLLSAYGASEFFISMNPMNEGGVAFGLLIFLLGFSNMCLYHRDIFGGKL